MNRPLGIIATILLLALVFVTIRFLSDDGHRSAILDGNSGNVTGSAQGEANPGIADTVNQSPFGQDANRHEHSVTHDELRTDLPVDEGPLTNSAISSRATTGAGTNDPGFADPANFDAPDSNMASSHNAFGAVSESPDKGVRNSINPEPVETGTNTLGLGAQESGPQDFGPAPGEDEPQVFGPGPGENEPQVFGPGPGENEPQVFGPGPGEDEPQDFGPGPGEDDSKADDSNP